MPRAEILSKQALHTLTYLHAELAGKIGTNRKSGDKLCGQMVQVEAVIKVLEPDFQCPAGPPMTAREIMLRELDGKTPEAIRKQEVHLQAAILAAVRDHAGKGVEQVGDARPARWRSPLDRERFEKPL
jgi:hypothetical protein